MCVSNHVGDTGTWAIDRQEASQTLLRKFLGDQKQFILRLTGNRNVLYEDKTINVGKLAKNLKAPYNAEVIRYKYGKEEQLKIQYGMAEVRLPVFEGRQEEQPFRLVEVNGFGQEPMMLLRNRSVNAHAKEEIRRVVEIIPHAGGVTKSIVISSRAISLKTFV